MRVRDLGYHAFEAQAAGVLQHDTAFVVEVFAVAQGGAPSLEDAFKHLLAIQQLGAGEIDPTR